MIRIERTYNDAMSQSTGPNDIADAIKARMKLGMQKYVYFIVYHLYYKI